MNPSFRALPCVFLWAAVAALPASGAIERTLERTFTVRSGEKVKVDITGGPIAATVGPAGSVQLKLKQEIRVATENEADEALAKYEVAATQENGEVLLVARRREKLGWHNWNDDKVRFSASITVPADVRLDLDTSGGSIKVVGETSAAIRADTSGGSIAVDGGSGDMFLDTSGGSIRVGRASAKLHADTSGGSITVEQVGATATDVNLDTSGGSIDVGVDPAAKLDLAADTSGGRVKVEGLAFEPRAMDRSHASGRINGGGAKLRADTSGGSISIHRAGN